MKVVQKILGQATMFDIQDVIINNSGNIYFGSVLVNMITRGIEEAIIGSALVKIDLNEAIAKATLSAINRRIEKSGI